MYQRAAEREGWTIELMSLSEGIPGSIKEVIFTMRGKGVYGRLRYESGVHRVQRVPETESQGRIHTSAATVAVLPEAEEVGSRDRSQGSPYRRVPLLRPRWSVGEHNRFGRAHHPYPDGARRVLPG